MEKFAVNHGKWLLVHFRRRWRWRRRRVKQFVLFVQLCVFRYLSFVTTRLLLPPSSSSSSQTATLPDTLAPGCVAVTCAVVWRKRCQDTGRLLFEADVSCFYRFSMYQEQRDVSLTLVTSIFLTLPTAFETPKWKCGSASPVVIMSSTTGKTLVIYQYKHGAFLCIDPWR